MSYILLISNIHPRTKTRNLSDDKVKKLYGNMRGNIDDYSAGKRICEFNDILGNAVAPKNDVVRMNPQFVGSRYINADFAADMYLGYECVEKNTAENKDFYRF